MNMFIGENIRRLRKEKNITQEKLAEHLNISCPAVSKWERGETYPDITMVLPVASYFGVSTDELLGFDAAKNESKIQEYLDEFNRLNNLGKSKESFELTDKMYSEFPNDFRVLEKYLFRLCYDPDTEKNRYITHKDKLISICERILDECSIDDIRYSAIDTLSSVYYENGQVEKAIETANRFPYTHHSKNIVLSFLFECGSKERIKYTKEYICEITNSLIVAIRNIALEDNSLSLDEQILIFEKAILLIKLIYDEGDYIFQNCSLCDLYIWVANRYIQKNEYETAIDYLEKGLHHAKTYDEIPIKPIEQKSLLVKGKIMEMNKVFKCGEGNQVNAQFDYFERKKELYSLIAENSRFVSLLEKYKPLAKTCK